MHSYDLLLLKHFTIDVQLEQQLLSVSFLPDIFEIQYAGL